MGGQGRSVVLQTLYNGTDRCRRAAGGRKRRDRQTKGQGGMNVVCGAQPA